MNNRRSIAIKADHVSIGVQNYDESVAWYRDKLGFLIEREWTVEGLPGVKLAYLTRADFRIEIIAGGRGAPMTVPVDFADHFNRPGFGHLCFWTEDVDETLLQLGLKGVSAFVPTQNYPVGAERRVAFVLDNSGNVIEFAGPIV